MAKSNIVRHKGPGRPVTTGKTPTVTIRLPAALIAGLDALAKVRRATRTDIMREILEQALAATPSAEDRARLDKLRAMARVKTKSRRAP
jgi:hypothetical protein